MSPSTFEDAFGILLVALPVLLLFFLVNESEKHHSKENPDAGKGLWILCCIPVILFSLLSFGVGIFVHLLHFIDPQTNAADLQELAREAHISSDLLLQILGRAHWIGMALWIPALISLLIFIPAVRRAIARVIPFNSDSRIQTLSLALSMLIIFAPLSLTAGLGSGLLNHFLYESQHRGVPIISFWMQSLVFALLGFIGVGWLSRRSFKEAAARLGLFRPGAKEIGLAIASGIVLAVVISLIESWANNSGWGMDPVTSKYVEQLFSPLMHSAIGILTLGLAAALGEEIIFRGALQPKFGIAFTSLLFAFTHNHFGLSLPIAAIFLIGFILGYFRFRYSTTGAIILHATYNITIGVLPVILPHIFR